MDAKTTRKHLDEYRAANRDIQLTEAAIEILERVTGSHRVIATLKKSQQRHLLRLDRAAEKLGANYGR